MKNRIFVIGSSYALLIVLLKYGEDQNDVFIMNGHTVSSYAIQYLKEKHPVFVRKENSMQNSILRKLRNSIKEYKRYKDFLKKHVHDDSEIIGHDHILSISFPLWGRFMTVIEDGYINSLEYELIKKTFKSQGRKYYFFLNQLYRLTHSCEEYRMYGFDKSVKHVLLTSDKYCCDISSKVEVVSLNNLWDALLSEDKQEVSRVFLGDVIQFNKPVSILITQPLSEDGLMSENEKIGLYRTIIENESNLFIKPHPRERTSYQDLFPDARLINQEIPLEIIALTCEKISRVYTCFSTAANIFANKCAIQYISMENYPEIVSRYHL